MSLSHLPLYEFLQELAAADIHITLNDVRRVQHLLGARTQWTHAQLCQTLSALLAKSERQKKLLEQLYRRKFQQAGDIAIKGGVDVAALRQDLQLLITQYEQPVAPVIDDVTEGDSDTPSSLSRWAVFSGVVSAVILAVVIWQMPDWQDDAADESLSDTVPYEEVAQSDLVNSRVDEASSLIGGQPGEVSQVPDEYTGHAEKPDATGSPPIDPDSLTPEITQSETPGFEQEVIKSERSEQPEEADSEVGSTAKRLTSLSEVTGRYGALDKLLNGPIRTLVEEVHELEDDHVEHGFEAARLAWLAFLAGLLFAGFLGWQIHRSRKMPEIPAALHWDKQGAAYFDPGDIGGEMPRWLADDTLDFCADSVGYEYSSEAGTQPDIVATIKASAQAAGQPMLRMLPRRMVHQVLVLVDLQTPAQRWCPLAMELVRGLRMRGLPVTLGWFHGDLQSIRTDEGEFFRLDDLHERQERFVTLIFADAHLPDWGKDLRLLESLSVWPRLVWLTVREQRFWNGREERLQQAGFRLHLADPARFAGIFAELVGDKSPVTPDWQGYLRFRLRDGRESLTRYVHRLLGDTLPLARLVAVLPPPVSPALLTRLLREFAAHLPLTRLQRLYALPGVAAYSRHLHLDHAVLGILRAEFHELHSGDEKAAVGRQLLAWYLEASPVETDSLRYYQWQWRYLRLMLEFSPAEAIPEMERLQRSITPLAGGIVQEQKALPIQLPAADDDANRKRLYRMSKGKVISEAAVWPAIPGKKRQLAGVLGLVGLLGGLAVWQTLGAIKDVRTKWHEEISWEPVEQEVIEHTEWDEKHGANSLVQRLLNTPEPEVVLIPPVAEKPVEPVITDDLADAEPVPAGQPVEPVVVVEPVVKEPVPVAPSVDPVIKEPVVAELPVLIAASGVFPEMSVIPAGTFTMGCVEGRDDMIIGGCDGDEKPAHEVTVVDFELSTHEITNAQYVVFLNAVEKPGTEGQSWFGTSLNITKIHGIQGNSGTYAVMDGFAEYPVINVSWYGAKAYLDWLNQQSTDKAKGGWRLPTEAEWEYVARGGSEVSSAYSWGNEVPVCDLGAVNGAQFSGCNGDVIKVGSFTQNKHPFGLFDVHGNAWEWVEDCWQGDYNGAPVDGTARTDCGAGASRVMRVMRGGSGEDSRGYLRSGHRFRLSPIPRSGNVGFRAARTRLTLPFEVGSTPDQSAPLPERTGTPEQQAAVISPDAVTMEIIQTPPADDNPVIQPVRLYFPSGSVSSSELAPDTAEYIAGVVTILQKDPQLKIRLTGHTDSVGQAVANERLGLESAQQVRDLLVAEGAESEQIAVASGGEVVPIADNGTDEGRAKNRRVELELVTVAAFEPKMLEIKRGIFLMGCDPKRDDVEGGCLDREKPLHKVTVQTFWLSETEVTVAQYQACVDAGDCPEPEWREKGSDYHIETGSSDLYKRMGDALTGENYPVVGVSWNNARAYVAWLSKETGGKYRLPTEAEWEYAARASTDTAYPWGNSIGENKANCSGDLCGDSYQYTSPVGSFSANPFGLKDMNGNVWEWVEDCWRGDYKGAPANGKARTDCGADASRVLRGGSWSYGPRDLRSADRNYDNPGSRYYNVGFRAARTN